MCPIGSDQPFPHEFGISINAFRAREGGFIHACAFKIAVNGRRRHEHDLIDVFDFRAHQFQDIAQRDQLKVKGEARFCLGIHGAGDGGHMDDLGGLEGFKHAAQIGQQTRIAVHQHHAIFPQQQKAIQQKVLIGGALDNIASGFITIFDQAVDHQIVAYANRGPHAGKLQRQVMANKASPPNQQDALVFQMWS